MTHALLIGTLADRTTRAIVQRVSSDPRVTADYVDPVALQLRGGVEARHEAGAVHTVLFDGARDLRLSDYDRVFCRWLDLSTGTDDPDERAASRAIYQGLGVALDHCRVPMMNRPFARRSLFSKVTQLVDFGELGPWRVPRSLLSNVAHEVAERVASWPSGAIVKGASGHKTWVGAVEVEEVLARAAAIERCPVLVQERCPGEDVRVHVVGERCFAEAIVSEAVDYRCDRASVHRPIRVPARIAEGCLAIHQRLGLRLSGVDFRVDGDAWWFLEVNPLPDLLGYDTRANGAITEAICDWISGAA